MDRVQLFVVMVGILCIIVLAAVLIRVRQRRTRREGHLVVDMGRRETIAETGPPSGRDGDPGRGAAEEPIRPA
ncbi:MAG: hypothetical protein M3N07_04455 [Pseudomonadota bacterium]|nr:hypothetical protein [Pseudomonadota bacterium]